MGIRVEVGMSTTDTVKAMLSPKGLEHFENFFVDLAEGQQQPRAALPGLPPADADGYHHFPLWMFVSVFGGSEVRSPQDFAQYFEGGGVVF